MALSHLAPAFVTIRVFIICFLVVSSVCTTIYGLSAKALCVFYQMHDIEEEIMALQQWKRTTQQQIQNLQTKEEQDFRKLNHKNNKLKRVVDQNFKKLSVLTEFTFANTEHDQKPARATLYDHKNYRKKEEYNERESWEPGCMNFRTLDQNVGYIQTHNSCISLFMERNCKGWQTKFFKDSRVLNGPWRFKFRSIGPCADALRPIG